MSVEQQLGFFPPNYVSDYFVSADIGSDSFTGRSELRPFATLGKALDAAETGGTKSVIHILDRNEYQVTEDTGTPNERSTTVEIVILSNGSTLVGQPTGVSWFLNKSRISGMNCNGDNLTFRPTGATTGQTDHVHTWYKVEDPAKLYETIATDPTPNRWIINAGRIKGLGPLIDADNAAATFYHVYCNDIGLDFNSGSTEYIFIGNGAGVIINYIGLNTDNSNIGAGVGKIIKLDNNSQAHLMFNCFGGGAANGGDINSGSTLFVFGGSVDGEPLTWLGTGTIHDHSIVDGINFANMNVTAGLDLADLINVRDVGTGRQVSATLTQLQTLMGIPSPLAQKAGIVAPGSFALSGGVYKATVTFSTAFSDAAYSPLVTGDDIRTWSIESRVAASFIINSGSAVAPSGDTYWTATKSGESP